MYIKNVLILLCILTTTSASAQSWMRYKTILPPQWKINLPTPPATFHNYIVDHQIDTLHITYHRITKNGQVKRGKEVSHYAFNDQGMIMEFNQFRKGVSKKRETYTYDTMNNLTSKLIYNKKNLVSFAQFQEFDKRNSTRYLSIAWNKDTSYEVVRIGMNDQRKSYEYLYKKGKLKNRWENEFYPDSTRKKSTLYNGKGKVKYVWDYRCKEEGVEIYKHKDTSKICLEKSTDNQGITTYLYKWVEEDGTLITTLNKMNRFNKMIYIKQTQGIENRITFENVWEYYDNDTSLKFHSNTSYRKGNISWTSKKSYDKNGNETESSNVHYNKGKVVGTYKQSYTYFADNRPKQRILFNEEKGTQRIIEYTYN